MSLETRISEAVSNHSNPEEISKAIQEILKEPTIHMAKALLAGLPLDGVSAHRTKKDARYALTLAKSALSAMFEE